MQKLATRFLNVALDAVLHPPSIRAEEIAREQQAAANANLQADEIDFLRMELAEAKAKLKDFECPQCEAPLELRVFHNKTAEYRGKSIDYDVEYVRFTCGYEMVDGTTTTECKCESLEPEPPERDLRD